ncbi:MAG TPA: FecR domain-containing protein [Anaerolineales bacterium]|nr:FecR domain-containing protein [Anaerolineales bacterium]
MFKLNFTNLAATRVRALVQVRTNQIYLASVFVFILIVILIAVLAGHSGSSAGSAALTAVVKETQGQVTIKQPGQNDFSAASPGVVLQLHGQLQTGSSSTARLDLSSGTIIRVAPSSLFTLQANQTTANGLTTTLNLTLGQIFIILKGGSLDITVPSGVASVRGSFMSALIYPPSNKVFVECLEGECAATNNAGALNLTDGQKGILIYTGAGIDQLPQLTPMNQNDYASWLAISPEAQSIINQGGNGQNQGKSSPDCQPVHGQPCK